jgi:hypothetical protein
MQNCVDELPQACLRAGIQAARVLYMVRIVEFSYINFGNLLSNLGQNKAKTT